VQDESPTGFLAGTLTNDIRTEPVIDSADQVLQHLQSDAVFMSLIGRYEFGNGLEQDSIVVLASNQQVPGVKNVRGVECVISRVPDTSSRAVISGCSIRLKKWTIHLIQYKDSTPNQAVEAADRLCDLAPGATYTHLGSNFSDMAGVEQIVVKIPSLSPLIAPAEL